jgi:hypothetical protein
MGRVIPSPDKESAVAIAPVSGDQQTPRIIPAPTIVDEQDTSNDENILVESLNSVFNFGKGIYTAATGEGVELEYPNVPELTDVDDESIGFWEAIPINTKMMLARDDNAKAEIISDHFAGDERFGGIASDKFGHPMIVWNHKPYYINKPGFTPQDFRTFIGELIKFAPASKFVRGAKSFKGTLIRGVPSYTATEIAGQALEAQLAPKAAVAERKSLPEKFQEAGTLGTLSATIEAALPPVARAAGRAIAATGRAISSPFPHLSTVASATRKPYLSTYASATKDALGPEGTGWVPAKGVTQESKFPLTQGQRTAEPPIGVGPKTTRQLEEEDVMRHSASVSGETGGDLLRGFEERVISLIRRDARELQDEFGSGGMAGQEGRVPEAAAERIQIVVSGEAGKLKSQAGIGYKAVHEADSPPVMTPSGVVDTAARMRNAVFGKPPDSLGYTAAELVDMPLLAREAKYLSRAQKIWSKEGARGVPLNALHGIQKRLNRAISSADKNTPEGVALIAMKRELDDAITRGIDEGFMTGDKAILDQLKSATGLYRQYMQITGVGKAKGPRAAANKILEKLSDQDYTPVALANVLFGHAKFNPNQAVGMALDTIKKILPEEAHEEVIRLLKDAVIEKAFSGRGGEVTRSNIIKNYSEIFVRQKHITEKIFSPEEIAKIAKFRKNVLPTLWSEIKLNPSGTSYIMLGALHRMGVMQASLILGKAAPLVGPTVAKAQEVHGLFRAKDMVTQYLQKSRTPLITLPSSALMRTLSEGPTSGKSESLPKIKNIVDGLSPAAKQKLMQAVQ